MSISDPEVRSQKLDVIRTELRKYLDSCIKMKARSSFNIQYEAALQLTSSEKIAMARQVDASHGDVFDMEVSYSDTHRRNRRPVTHIAIKAKRRRIPLRR